MSNGNGNNKPRALLGVSPKDPQFAAEFEEYLKYKGYDVIKVRTAYDFFNLAKNKRFSLVLTPQDYGDYRDGLTILKELRKLGIGGTYLYMKDETPDIMAEANIANIRLVSKISNLDKILSL